MTPVTGRGIDPNPSIEQTAADELLTRRGQCVCYDKLLVVLGRGGQHDCDVLPLLVDVSPLRGGCTNCGAPITGAHLDGRSANDTTNVPFQFSGFPGNKRTTHVDAPPRRGVEIHSSGHLHSIGQFNRHGVVSVVGGVPNDDPLWGCHRNRCEIRVCAEFARHRNGDAISSTVTLLKGQCNGELHRFIGRNFGRTVRSYEILLNLLRGDITGIAGGGLVVRGCRRGDTTTGR